MNKCPDGHAERLLELAEENPLFREQFQDLLRDSMTDLQPNSDGFACVDSIKRYVDGMERPVVAMSEAEKQLHREMTLKVLGVNQP